MACMAVSVVADPGYFLFQNSVGTNKIFNVNEVASLTGTSTIKSNATYGSLRLAIYYSTNAIATNLTDRRAYTWPDNASSGITGTALYTNTSGIIGFNSLFDGRFTAGNASNTAYKVEAAVTNHFQVRVWNSTYGATWEAFKTNMDAGNVPVGTLYGLSPLFSFLPPDVLKVPAIIPPTLGSGGMPYWNLTAYSPPSPPAPAITTQPQSITNLLGSNATFTVSVYSTNAFVYAWYFNATNVIAGATNASLALTNIQTAAAGNYQVVVGNIYGSATSDVATLTVLVPAMITASPTNQAVATGDTATFAVSVAGTAPLSYQWYFNGTNVLAGMTNGTLILTNVQVTQAGSYQVIVTNAYGSATSAVALLAANLAPAIVANPADQSALAGSMASFTVNAMGTALSYQWFVNSTVLAGAVNASLTVTNVQASASYYVVITNQYGAVTSTVAALTLVQPLTITLNPIGQSVVVGGTVHFSVATTGTAPNYQWFRSVISNQLSVISGATNSQYAITNSQAGDAGNYFVVVTNLYSSVTSAVATLTVLLPPTITVNLTNQSVLAGNTAAFVIVASGPVPFTYQWFRSAISNQLSVISGATNSQYTIANSQAADAGNYQVVVANAYGSVTSAVAVLTILESPLIASSPTNQTVYVGGTAQFAVTATGTTPFTYQWYGLGSLLTGATNAALTLTNVQKVGEGSYYAVVANAYGSATSAVAVLTVLQTPAISAQPTDTSVSLAGSASFTVGVLGEPPFAYQWYKSVISNQLSVISEATNSQYSITNSQAGDAGDYVVVVTNLYGSATSLVAKLQVFDAPGITAQPKDTNALVGGSASFTVTALGAATLSYQWVFNGTNLLGNETNATLWLTNVSAAQVGSYQVVVTNASGSVTSAVAAFSLLFKPGITLHPVDQAILVGGSVSFTVDGSGTAPLTYQWYKGVTPILAATNLTLQLTNLQAADADGYLAVASNPYGSATSSVAVLTVLLPPAITLNPTNQSVVQGGATSLASAASGTAPLAYQWFRSVIGNQLSVISGATNSQYAITNSQAGDAGNYVVVVTNLYGSATSAVATLTVLLPPTITLNPTNQSAVLGGNVSFVAAVSGTAPFAYQWYKSVISNPLSVISGATNSAYSLPTAAALDAGDYQLVVTNLYGAATSSVATLTVLLPPGIALNPTNQAVVLGGNGSFTVAASGTAPFAYQWYKAVTSYQLSVISGATNSQFSIANSQAGDAGDYLVVVSNPYGSATSSVATLTILLPPSITLSPASQSVGLHGNFTLTVGVSATAPFHYQWFRSVNSNPLSVISGATNSQYTIANSQATDAGNYLVVVTNAYGAATSSVATLTVLLPPAITAQPVAATARVGGLAGFDVTASGAAPLFYQWFHNTLRIAGALDVHLSLTNVLPTDGGYYSVVVTNAQGAATSSVVLLTVQQPPVITVNPTNVIVPVGGGTSNLVVGAAGGTPLSFQWYHDGLLVPGATSDVLTLTKLTNTVSARGGYYAVVTNAYGSATSAVGFLSFVGGPTISKQPTNKVVAFGALAPFSVTATSKLPIKYQWLSNSVPIKGQISSLLSVTANNVNKAAAYSVVLSNAYGIVTSAVANLTIEFKPVLVSKLQNLYVPVGTTANVSVTVTGSPAMTYQWFKSTVKVPGATDSTLTLTNAQLANSGAYYVGVTNRVGSFRLLAANIFVQNPPVITSQPLSTNVVQKKTVVLKVLATGTATLKYQWLSNGIPIRGQVLPTLTLAAVTPNRSAGYSVVISNMVGVVTSQVAQVTVIVPQVMMVRLAPKLAGPLVAAKPTGPAAAALAAGLDQENLVSFSFAVEPGKTYQVQCKDGLNQDWQAAGEPLVATENVLTIQDDKAARTLRFYRVVPVE